METILQEIARQVPSLLVLAWIVSVFLRALDGIERRNEAAQTRVADAVTSLASVVGSCPKKD